MYQPGKGAEWPEEKKDKAYWEMKQRVENHGFLRHFYDSYLPYTEEVGEFDAIFEIGKASESLKDYHQIMAQAPDAIYRKNVQVCRPQPPQPPPPRAGWLDAGTIGGLPSSAQKRTDVHDGRTPSQPNPRNARENQSLPCQPTIPNRGYHLR